MQNQQRRVSSLELHYADVLLRTCSRPKTSYGSDVQLKWLGIGYQIYDRKIVGSTPGRDTIKKLLLKWVTVLGQVNILRI